MFKRTPISTPISTYDLTVTAVDRLITDISILTDSRDSTLSTFRNAADRLEAINDALADKVDLCQTMVAQLNRLSGDVQQQIADNEKVRANILAIIGG